MYLHFPHFSPFFPIFPILAFQGFCFCPPDFDFGSVWVKRTLNIAHPHGFRLVEKSSRRFIFSSFSLFLFFLFFFFLLCPFWFGGEVLLQLSWSWIEVEVYSLEYMLVPWSDSKRVIYICLVRLGYMAANNMTNAQFMTFWYTFRFIYVYS